MAGSIFSTAESYEKSLAYQDFCPVEVKKKEYESLEMLVEKANKWLEQHPHFSVKTAETYNIKIHKNGPEIERMSYMRKGQDEDSFTLADRNSYLRCLRLWLIPQMSSRKPAQIGVRTFSPKVKQSSNDTEFQLLNDTLKTMNDSFRMNPVPGHIISVETKPVKYTSVKKFNPSKSKWSEIIDQRKHFVFVIRIFYMIGSIVVETIEFKDFHPEIPLTAGGAVIYESLKSADEFHNLHLKAQQWLETVSGIRVSNMHTIDIKMKVSQFERNRELMSFTEHNERATLFWRALRAVVLTSVQSCPTSGIEKLTYRTFIPVMLTNKGQFESMSDTFNRIHAWLSVIKRSWHISILFLETVPIRLNTGGEKHHGAEAAWTVYKGARDERWIYIIRIYLDGTFTEPPPNSLPYVPPVLEKSTCKLQ
ncbi:hypothetical protein GQR58_011081 [Nymphon striatum]|nr:hypothetical protein GQR58_011081 [Nymphon striatum]